MFGRTTLMILALLPLAGCVMTDRRAAAEPSAVDAAELGRYRAHVVAGAAEQARLAARVSTLESELRRSRAECDALRARLELVTLD